MYVARTDQGTFPALNTTLKEEFDLSNIEIGSLGSLVYFGAFAGSAIAIPLFDYLPTRLVLVGCCLIQMVSLGAFVLVSTYKEQAIARFFSGAC